jgi:hypothetical protein
MERVFDVVTLSAMCSVQRAFDPLGLANPGKVLPAHVCGDRQVESTEEGS